MNDRTLDELLAGANPLPDDRVAGLALSEPLDDLREAIVAAPVGSDEQADGPDPSLAPTPLVPRRTRRWVRRTVAAAAAVAVFAGALAFLSRDDDPANKAWAAPAVAFAKSSPLILMGDSWEVTKADEYGEDEGEMNFSSDGEEDVSLFWRAGSFEEWREDRAASYGRTSVVDVLGHEATVYADARSGEAVTALWQEDGRTIEVQVNPMEPDRFRSYLRELRRVDVDAWLAAMPASVIRRAQSQPVVDEMLEGIPLPEGFNVAALEQGEEVKDRVQLEARVLGEVACAWLDQWAAATAAGDEVEEAEALEALRGAHDWPIAQGHTALLTMADLAVAGDRSITSLVPRHQRPSGLRPNITRYQLSTCPEDRPR